MASDAGRILVVYREPFGNRAIAVLLCCFRTAFTMELKSCIQNIFDGPSQHLQEIHFNTVLLSASSMPRFYLPTLIIERKYMFSAMKCAVRSQHFLRTPLLLLFVCGTAFVHLASQQCLQLRGRTVVAATRSARFRSIPAATGMSVLVDFAMTRADTGTPVGWSGVSSPLEFIAGAGEVPEPFEDAVIGMEEGETKRVFAYGEPDQDGEELWEILSNKEPPCDVPIMLDITLQRARTRQNKEGVVVQRILPGDGMTYPEAGDEISVHYKGRLASNGKLFDSTYKRQYPFTFRVGVGKVIPGWDIGMMKLSQGEKATLMIPAAMAYGKRGVDKVIPPNSDLIFEVHLVKIKKY